MRSTQFSLISKLIVFVVSPNAFSALSTIGYTPSSATQPVIMPFSRTSPSGRFSALYFIGLSPVTATFNINGLLGDAPNISGRLIFGAPSNGFEMAISV